MTIVIIGAGFSGSMIAVHLARQVSSKTRIVLMERAERFAEGVAYSTRDACHLLNVPAGRMSAFPDDASHFLRWAQRRRPDATSGAYLPRRDYAEYLRDILQETLGAAPPAPPVQRVTAEAVALQREAGTERLRVVDRGGAAIPADAVVLAIGNFPPSDPPCGTPEFYTSQFYCRDPWRPEGLEVDGAEDLLLLGTGLTMVDVAVSLRMRGHRGVIHGVSRRGLLPQTHRASVDAPPHRDPPAALARWTRTAPGLLRAVREAVAEGARVGLDWQDVLTSLRSVTPALWQSLPLDERARFLRHVRPYWETHRHRMAPEIGRTIQQMRADGGLHILAGRVEGYHVVGSSVEARVRLRGTEAARTLRVARVLNCTGPDTNLARVGDPLVQSLRDSGLIRPDPLGLGLDSDDAGRAVSAGGQVQPRVFIAGPLRRGSHWENVAVPELRGEAQRIAAAVARQVVGA